MDIVDLLQWPAMLTTVIAAWLVAAAIFVAYSPQLPLTAIDLLLVNAFYARQNARTPVLVGAA